MNWELTDAEWREFQATPEQGHSHRTWIDGAIRKRLDQLRTDEAVARLANCLHRLDHGNTLDHHDAVCERDRGGCDRRELYTEDARAAITALLGETK